MNYIAHLHIASMTNTSLLGNFLGDFVKGSNLSGYSEVLQQGIRLHRRVDHLTDTNATLLQIRQAFPQPLRKTAPIVVDVIFDHLLIKHWQRFNHIEQETMFNEFYTQLQHHTDHISNRYAQVRTSLLTKRWLSQYQHAKTCLYALQSIELRFTRKVIFAEKSYHWWQAHQTKFEEAFLDFYPALIKDLKLAQK